MQQAKQTKQIRSAIDELQQVPDGFVFNSQQVWTGLEQQLPGAKKKNTNFYYAAAAVLLIAGTVYLGFLKNDKSQVLNTPIASFPGLPQKKTVSPVIQQNKIQQHSLTSVDHSVKKKINPQINTVISDQKEMIAVEIKESLPTTVPSEQIAEITPPVNETQKPELKKLPLVTLDKPILKKYKVIHINELNSTVATPDLQNNMSRHEFKKMIQQNEENETFLPPNNTTTKQILFFKLKPATTTTTTLSEN